MGNRNSCQQLRRIEPEQKIDSSSYEPSISYLHGYLNKVGSGDDMEREKAFNHLKFITNFIYSLNGIYVKPASSNLRPQRV